MKVSQESENEPPEKKTPLTADSVTSPDNNKGFDFSVPGGSNEGFAFSTPNFIPVTGGSGDNAESANPFVFKCNSQQGSPGQFIYYFFFFRCNENLTYVCYLFTGSDRFTPDKNDISPKFTKPHSKERVAKEREREGGGKFSVLSKWLRCDDKGERRSSPGR